MTVGGREALAVQRKYGDIRVVGGWGGQERRPETKARLGRALGGCADNLDIIQDAVRYC